MLLSRFQNETKLQIPQQSQTSLFFQASNFKIPNFWCWCCLRCYLDMRAARHYVCRQWYWTFDTLNAAFHSIRCLLLCIFFLFSSVASFHRSKSNPVGGKSLLVGKVAALLRGAENRTNVVQFGCEMMIWAEVLHNKMTQHSRECVCQTSYTKSKWKWAVPWGFFFIITHILKGFRLRLIESSFLHC